MLRPPPALPQLIAEDEVISGDEVEEVEAGQEDDDKHVNQDQELPEEEQAWVRLGQADKEEDVDEGEKGEVGRVSGIDRAKLKCNLRAGREIIRIYDSRAFLDDNNVDLHMGK